MHPSLIEKPALSVADLHLLAKLLWDADYIATIDEAVRLERIEIALAEYVEAAVGPDWPCMEALVS